jgi:hypothetical protein
LGLNSFIQVQKQFILRFIRDNILTTENTTPQPSAEAAIHQLNLSYDAAQDRLLFRVGLLDNTELLVWLTNRITKQLWQLLNGETKLPSATSIAPNTAPQAAVAQFKQEVKVAENLQKMDFATEYQPRKEVRNDKIMLATTVLMIAQSVKPMSLEMPCFEGIIIRMNLTDELILAMVNMLQLTCKESGWDIGAPHNAAQTPILMQENDKKILH